MRSGPLWPSKMAHRQRVYLNRAARREVSLDGREGMCRWPTHACCCPALLRGERIEGNARTTKIAVPGDYMQLMLNEANRRSARCCDLRNSDSSDVITRTVAGSRDGPHVPRSTRLAGFQKGVDPIQLQLPGFFSADCRSSACRILQAHPLTLDKTYIWISLREMLLSGCLFP
jgi:hypothetical protein